MYTCEHFNLYFNSVSDDLRNSILYFAKEPDAHFQTVEERDKIIARAQQYYDFGKCARLVFSKLRERNYDADAALDLSFSFQQNLIYGDAADYFLELIDAGTEPQEAYNRALIYNDVDHVYRFSDEGTQKFIEALLSSGRYDKGNQEDADKIIDLARQYESLNDDETREAYAIARQDYNVEEALKIARRLNYVMADAYELYRTLVRNGTDAKEAAEQANTFDDFSEDAQELYFDLIDREDVTAQSLFDIVERYNALDENTQDAFKHLLDPDASGTIRTAEDAISDAETLADYGMCFISDTANPEDVGYGVWDNLDGASFSWIEDEYIGNYFNLSRYCARTGKSEEDVNVEELDRDTLEEFFDFSIYGREFLNEHETFTDRYGALWYIYN